MIMSVTLVAFYYPFGKIIVPTYRESLDARRAYEDIVIQIKNIYI